MKQVSYWVPAMFCAFLSLLAIGMSLFGPTAEGWKPVFFCFLPMCFVFVGLMFSKMHKEIHDLREQLSALQQGRPK